MDNVITVVIGMEEKNKYALHIWDYSSSLNQLELLV